MTRGDSPPTTSNEAIVGAGVDLAATLTLPSGKAPHLRGGASG
jgi:hypothetical protein